MREEEREEMEWASGIGPNNTMGIEGNDWAIGQASPPPLEHNGHLHNTPFYHDMYPHPYDYSTGAEAKTDLTEQKLEGDGIVPQITQTLDPAPLWTQNTPSRTSCTPPCTHYRSTCTHYPPSYPRTHAHYPPTDVIFWRSKRSRDHDTT